MSFQSGGHSSLERYGFSTRQERAIPRTHNWEPDETYVWEETHASFEYISSLQNTRNKRKRVMSNVTENKVAWIKSHQKYFELRYTIPTSSWIVCLSSSWLVSYKNTIFFIVHACQLFLEHLLLPVNVHPSLQSLYKLLAFNSIISKRLEKRVASKSQKSRCTRFVQ